MTNLATSRSFYAMESPDEKHERSRDHRTLRPTTLSASAERCERLYVPRTAAQKHCRRFTWNACTGELLATCTPDIRTDVTARRDRDARRREYKRLEMRAKRSEEPFGARTRARGGGTQRVRGVEGCQSRYAGASVNPISIDYLPDNAASAEPPPRNSRRPSFNFARARAHAREAWCHTSVMTRASSPCAAKLRSGDLCQSVATTGEFCAYHAALAAELGSDPVETGQQTKRRNARQRVPVIAESEPLVLTSTSPGAPSGVRPALALTAAEEVETIRRVLLEAATSTTRETWATCTCPECGKGFRQEITVPDHGARIKAVETCCARGSAASERPRSSSRGFPNRSRSCRNLSTAQLGLMVGLGYAAQIRADRRPRRRCVPPRGRTVDAQGTRSGRPSPRRGRLTVRPDLTSI